MTSDSCHAQASSDCRALSSAITASHHFKPFPSRPKFVHPMKWQIKRHHLPFHYSLSPFTTSSMLSTAFSVSPDLLPYARVSEARTASLNLAYSGTCASCLISPEVFGPMLDDSALDAEYGGFFLRTFNDPGKKRASKHRTLTLTAADLPHCRGVCTTLSMRYWAGKDSAPSSATLLLQHTSGVGLSCQPV